MKTNITVSIDVEVAKEAKEKLDNISQTVETLLRKELKL